MAFEVLIVDDEAAIREGISDIVKDEGFLPKAAENSLEALKILNDKVPGVIILDIWLQGSDLDGLGILEIVKKRYPLLPVIIISGHGTIETAVTAIKMGAYDYLEKPFTHEKLMIVLRRACEAAKLKRENIDLRSKVIDRSEMVGQSPAINKLRTEIEKVSPTSGRVMITGPIGCGKELAARLIHRRSKYSSGPFIIFSPTGMSEERIKYELFGQPNKSSLNFNAVPRSSILEVVNKGTLYIDEVADLPLTIQYMLLKFLQDGNFEKGDSKNAIKLDIRLITATSKNIQNEITIGRFRQDLYYRLNVISIQVPSLSSRKEDISLLAEYFIGQLVRFSGLRERKFSNEAVAALQAYHWPGNLRQLRNVIEWALIMNPLTVDGGDEIKANMLPTEIINNGGGSIVKPDTNVDMMSMPLREAREVFERQYLAAQMSRFNNNISKTSTFVGMERSALHRKLKLLNISSNNRNKEKENNDEKEALIAVQTEECLA